MYTGIYYERSKKLLHIWDDVLGYNTKPYKAKAFKISKVGTYKTLYGQPAIRVDSWSEKDTEYGLIYESDIEPCTSYLIDTYLNDDDPSTTHRILFYDIEIEKSEKYSTPDQAYNSINAITAYNNVDRKYVTWLLDDIKPLEIKNLEISEVRVFKDEHSLLSDFLLYWEGLRPTIVTGWNSTYFDDKYIINRIEIVLGKGQSLRLSPIGIIDKSKDGSIYKIAGVVSLDYLLLYKKFNPNEEPSYKLDAISKKELGHGKIEYSGSLDELYYSDINKFIAYSITDVKLLVELDDKLKFINLSLAICHECHVPYEHIWMSSFYLDGAAITFSRRKNICLPNKKYGSDDGTAQGAFVKDPKTGFHYWVYDLDLKALYPSTIQSYNISPETKVGKIEDWDEVLYFQKQEDINWKILYTNGDIEYIHNNKLKLHIESLGLIISSNGMLYRSDVTGLLPEILTVWANERDQYKDLMKKYKKEGDELKQQYYHTRQWVKKIQSNSLYGVLLLPSFRFYDKDNGEAITVSSQSLIKFTSNVANNQYNNVLETKDIDYCIAGDTDSTFFSALPIIQKRNPNYNIELDSFDNASKIVIDVATEIQNLINKSYDWYAKVFHNCHNHHFKIKQEVVSRRSIWIAKKRYAQWKIYEEGVMLNQSNTDACLDVKGIDVVRSNFPNLFRRFTRQVLIDILNDKTKDDINTDLINFKTNLKAGDFIDMMIPTSVKELSKWESKDRFIFKFIKGTPVHCKAALAYNDFLKFKKLNQYRKLSNGDKILWAYLKVNPYNLSTMAIQNENDPPEILNFISEYIDRDMIFNQILISKLNDFYSVLGWGIPQTHKETNDFF